MAIDLSPFRFIDDFDFPTARTWRIDYDYPASFQATGGFEEGATYWNPEGWGTYYNGVFYPGFATYQRSSGMPVHLDTPLALAQIFFDYGREDWNSHEANEALRLKYVLTDFSHYLTYPGVSGGQTGTRFRATQTYLVNDAFAFYGTEESGFTPPGAESTFWLKDHPDNVATGAGVIPIGHWQFDWWNEHPSFPYIDPLFKIRSIRRWNMETNQPI